MTRPHSEDIRERALARADAGDRVRSIAQALQISPSCVTKRKNLRRDTGGLAPGEIGGHKKPVLSAAGICHERPILHTAASCENGSYALRLAPPIWPGVLLANFFLATRLRMVVARFLGRDPLRPIAEVSALTLPPLAPTLKQRSRRARAQSRHRISIKRHRHTHSNSPAAAVRPPCGPLNRRGYRGISCPAPATIGGHGTRRKALQFYRLAGPPTSEPREQWPRRALYFDSHARI